MKQVVSLCWAVMMASFLVSPVTGEGPEGQSSLLAEIFEKNQPPIAGMPYMEAFAIMKRHRPVLRQLPGVEGLSLQEEGLLVYTDQPELVPSTLEGLPVITLPRLGVDDPPEPGEPVDEKPPLAQHQESHRAQPEQDCGPYAHWVQEVGRCRVDTLPPHLSKALARTPVPPPAGVIVLRSDGKRDEAEACPKGFKETAGKHGWRFCIDPAHPQPIPPLWKAPIAGIPFEEAQAILERHRDELWQIPGVRSHGLGAEGIVVGTDQPDLVPTEIEGLPVKTRPPVIMRPLSHTNLLPKRPLRGSLKITDQLWPATGTLTGIGISEGKPWLIFPAHGVAECQNMSGCPPGTTSLLNECSHYAGTRRLHQPLTLSQDRVGFIQRWDRIAAGGLPNTDVAAAFMDNNTVEGDGSLKAIREIETFGSFSGLEEVPDVGETVTFVSSQDVDGDHTFNLIVERVNVNDQDVFYDIGDCIDPFFTGSPSPFLARYVDQIIYSTPPGQGDCIGHQNINKIS